MSKIRQRLMADDNKGQQDAKLHARVWSNFVDNSPADLCEESKHLLMIAKQYLGKGSTLLQMVTLLYKYKEVIQNRKLLQAIKARKIATASQKVSSGSTRRVS